jgi:ribonuclease Z
MESYGYRFDTKDRSIVISGDTNPAEATIAACNSCDVLIHEVVPVQWLTKMPVTFQQFAAKYHTTTYQLAELAKRAKPKLLVLYHFGGQLYDEILNDMKSRYEGKFALGRDFDVY